MNYRVAQRGVDSQILIERVHLSVGFHPISESGTLEFRKLVRKEMLRRGSGSYMYLIVLLVHLK